MKQFYNRGVLFAALLAVLGALTVWVQPAQAQLLQGSITGNVTDASQAAVVGAIGHVATEQTTNFTRDTTTNGSGGYNLPTMPPGTYTITVTAPSFQTSTITGVRVSPEEVTRTNVTLTIGQLTQNVEVSADAIRFLRRRTGPTYATTRNSSVRCKTFRCPLGATTRCYSSRFPVSRRPPIRIRLPPIQIADSLFQSTVEAQTPTRSASMVAARMT